jgi:hypothetical protein
VAHCIALQSNVEIIGYEAEGLSKATAFRGVGRMVSRQCGHNLVVLNGRNLIRDLLNGDNVSELTDFAFGTDATAVSDSDAALGAQVLKNSITQTVKSPSALQLKYFLSSTALNGITIREIGLFSDLALFARYIVSPEIVKTNALVFTFSWVITLTSS